MPGQNLPVRFGHVRNVFFGRPEAQVGTVETSDVFVRFVETAAFARVPARTRFAE